MRALIGHTKDVRAVAYLPDGRLVSGGSDRTVRIWNVHAGESTLTVKAAGPVYAVAAAPSGVSAAYSGRPPPPQRLENLVVIIGTDTGSKLDGFDLRAWRDAWEYYTGIASRDPAHRPSPLSVRSLSFSADGQILAAAYRRPGGGNIPNGAGAHWWRRLERTDGPINDQRAYTLRFAPTGTALAITTEGRAVVFRSPEDLEPTISVPLPAAWAESVTFIPGQPTVVVGANSFLIVFDATGAGKPRRIKTQFRGITAVAPTPDGRSVVVGGKPGAVEVYDPATGTLRASYDFGLGMVYDVAVAPDGLTFAVAGEKGLAVFDADDW